MDQRPKTESRVDENGAPAKGKGNLGWKSRVSRSPRKILGKDFEYELKGLEHTIWADPVLHAQHVVVGGLGGPLGDLAGGECRAGG